MEIQELVFRSGFLLGCSKELIKETINHLNGYGTLSEEELKARLMVVLRDIYELEFETTTY